VLVKVLAKFYGHVTDADKESIWILFYEDCEGPSFEAGPSFQAELDRDKLTPEAQRYVRDGEYITWTIFEDGSSVIGLTSIWPTTQAERDEWRKTVEEVFRDVEEVFRDDNAKIGCGIGGA
jgi:hypothetical protein